MKQIRNFILVAAAALMAAACGEEVTPEDSLSLQDGTVAVAAAGASQDITFTTNVSWTVASNQTWVTVTPAEGAKGDVTVKATVAANTLAEARTAKVTVTAGDKSAVITFNQAAAAASLKVTETTLSVAAEGETKTINLEANTAWTATASESWVTLAPASGKAADKAISVTVAANAAFTARTATVTVTAGDQTATVTVDQAAAKEPDGSKNESFDKLGDFKW